MRSPTVLCRNRGCAGIGASGLVGVRASFGEWLELAPLADDSVTYFALDNLLYHGRNICSRRRRYHALRRRDVRLGRRRDRRKEPDAGEVEHLAGDEKIYAM